MKNCLPPSREDGKLLPSPPREKVNTYTLRLVGDAVGNRSLTPYPSEERDHVGEPLGAKGLLQPFGH